VTDRPDATEASSTVGRGRIQLESGYTFSSKAAGAGYTWTHTYPELLLRVGLFAEWFELRVGQFWTNQVDTTTGNRLVTGGAEDLYLGVKLGLTEQKRLLPETALILQMTAPSGSPGFSTGEVMPGLNFCYGWEVIKNRFEIDGSIGANRVLNDIGQDYALVNASTSLALSLTRKLGSYAEWFAFFPVGSLAPGSGAQHYINGGFTYKVTRNFQLDVRAGKGLSAAADDYFAGAGFAIRH
jgi:Putative MetA-pathway of phenol degradation